VVGISRARLRDVIAAMRDRREPPQMTADRGPMPFVCIGFALGSRLNSARGDGRRSRSAWRDLPRGFVGGRSGRARGRPRTRRQKKGVNSSASERCAEKVVVGSMVRGQHRPQRSITRGALAHVAERRKTCRKPEAAGVLGAPSHRENQRGDFRRDGEGGRRRR